MLRENCVLLTLNTHIRKITGYFFQPARIEVLATCKLAISALSLQETRFPGVSVVRQWQAGLHNQLES